mmetsp:Transcript_71828/g.155957  ORF Transcript_71828/g.155957 Transcript_71828/m.155957 type:complete len:229 (+) Transcript_71828:2485-3171(+)
MWLLRRSLPPGSAGDDKGLVCRSVIWDLPAFPRRRGRGAARVIGPDLITADLRPKPPAAKIWSVTAVPKIDHHLQPIDLGVLAIRWLAMVFPSQGETATDNAAHGLVHAARDDDTVLLADALVRSLLLLTLHLLLLHLLHLLLLHLLLLHLHLLRHHLLLLHLGLCASSWCPLLWPCSPSTKSRLLLGSLLLLLLLHRLRIGLVVGHCPGLRSSRIAHHNAAPGKFRR